MLILIAVSFALYWQATGFELVWDDARIHLTKNPYFNILCFDNFLHFWKEPYESLYIPISYNLWGILNIISRSLYSKPYDPFIYHFVNIFLHTLNALLVFTLLRQIIKTRWAVAAGTLLFLIHPLQIESVVWISEFRGLLASFFGLSALYFYLKYCHIKYEADGFKSLYILNINISISLILFICALLSKPSAAVIPLFAVLIEYYLYSASLKRIASHIWLFLIPIAIITIITSSVQESAVTYPFWAKPLLWMDAITFYLYKIFIPFSLAASYARTPEFLMEQWWFYVIWIIPVSFGFFLWYIREKRPVLVLSALLFIAGFLPVSSLMEFEFQAWAIVADRYLYLSMFGIALGFAYITDHIKHKWQWSIILSIIVFLIGWNIIVQIPTWKDNFTLWDHCIQITPLEPWAYNNRGIIYADRQEYEKAIQDYNKAISIKHDHAGSYNNRGNIYLDRKDYGKAMQDFNKAISIKHDFAEAYNNHGIVYFVKKEYEKAMQDYNKAILIKHDYADAYNNRGSVYFVKKEYEKAIQDYNKAILIKHDYADAYANRAVSWFYMKEYNKSLSDVKKCQSLGGKVNPLLLQELKKIKRKPNG